MPKFKPDTGYGKKPAAPKYVQPGIDPNTTAANIAAQQNVQPANINPLTMKTGPFKMKHNNSSFPFKSSPAKDWRKGGDPKEDAKHNEHMRKPPPPPPKPKGKTQAFSPTGFETTEDER